MGWRCRRWQRWRRWRRRRRRCRRCRRRRRRWWRRCRRCRRRTRLQHAQAGADDGCVAEAEDLPAVTRRVIGDGLLEPRDLLVVHHHLVRRVLRRAELGRAEADDERLVSDLVAELRRLLAELAQVDLEVGLVREELVDALQVVVAAHHVELRPEAVEEVMRELEALGGAREERSRAGAVLGLTEVAERDHELGRVRRREDLLEVVAPEEPVSKQGCNTKAPAQTERLIC